MSQDYIFCPFCGGTKWITDKTKSAPGGKLTYHMCAGCKKFIYTDITTLIDHPILVSIYQTTRYSVKATIDPYIIEVLYKQNITNFWDSDDPSKLIMTVNSAVTFNWYKNEELIKKIKKYVVFS
jgi:hypothetical protein